MCNPEADHYTWELANAQADYEWTASRAWYQISFCNCGGWVLIPGVCDVTEHGEYQGESGDAPGEGAA